ncbi:NHP2 [Symbiodinium sp. KB8]|nr:NHP2 [Symbiodinium sp. KB8]
MADKKQTKRIYKAVGKGEPLQRAAEALRRGVKEVQKALRKGETGCVLPLTAVGQGKSLVVIAADISPLDVISHLPVYCEEQGVPYMFVKSKAELGESANTKRPTSCVLINTQKPWEGRSKADEVIEDAKKLIPGL